MKYSMKLFHSIPYSQVYKTLLMVCGLLIYLFLFIFSNFPKYAIPARSWDTNAFYIGIDLFFAVLYFILYLKEKAEVYQALWVGLMVICAFSFVFECYSALFHININSSFIYITLTYIATLAVVAAIVWKVNGIAEATRSKLIAFCKPLAIGLFAATFVFLYAPLEFPDVSPMQEWDRALFYTAQAVQLIAGFSILFIEEEHPLYKKMWGSLLVFCTVYLLRLVKLIFWGTNGWTKMFCTGLFYLTLGYIIFSAICHADKNDNIPKLK